MLTTEPARIIVRGQLPSLNEYIAAMNANRHKGNDMKAEAAQLVGWCARATVRAGVRFEGLVHVSFLWVEPNRKRDKDNIAFAKKFILDALQPVSKACPYGVGIIAGDGWRHVDGFTDRFDIDPKNPRIEVLIEEIA